MTVSPNLIRGGLKTNIVPDGCELDVDIRIMPGQDRDYVFRELSPLAEGAEIRMTQYFPPTFSTADSPFYRLIAETMGEFTGDDLILPCIGSGATDSRYMRTIGVPCYGISMLMNNLSSELKESVHGKNEKIDIESLQIKTIFLIRLAESYLNS